MKHWTTTAADVDKRLDHFLVEQGAASSRSAIQKHIQELGVRVNGKKATVHRFLKDGDVIEMDEIVKKVKAKPAPVSSKKVGPLSPALTPTVIAETDDWLIINKPPGLLVHAARASSSEMTLVDWLLQTYPSIVKVGEDPVRPGIVHRLDREVSGLMIIAKTQDAYEQLGQQFRKRTTKKTYLGLTHGVIVRDEGDIKFRIARSTTAPRMAARPTQEEGGKAAWTHWQVLERFEGATLLRLEILSGRTHQIRAHLYALGRPIVGDALYALRKTDRNVKAPRLMLQSIGLEFDDPTTKERKVFTLEADPAFAKLTEEFRHS